MTVIIAGAGIGGLALALALERRRIDFLMFDAAEDLKPLGVGINILPHAIGELAEFGLFPTLDAIGVRTRTLRYINMFGQAILDEPRGLYAGHERPQLSIHRGMLHATMLAAVRERCGDAVVRTGHKFERFEQTGTGVTAFFRTLDGGLVEQAGSVLVGADGIHSMVRAQLHPDDGPMGWNGTMMWRGAVDWPLFDGGDTMIVSGDMKEKLLYYPIGRGATDGTMLTNWVLCRIVGDGSAPPPRRESWSRRGDLADILPSAKKYKIPGMDVVAMIEATQDILEYPMCDREPLADWGEGRVTLLGDAAHPMYPVGSNGAAQAVIDGKRLAHHLASGPVPKALTAYEAERIPVTSAIVRSNRGGGPERVVDVVSERAPNGFDRLEDVISHEELAAIGGAYAKMAGFALKEKQA
ncbi:flavin-dependent oxidoreductase [Beijerinckia sp. L45]|uniref:flavin-dependent oxidoreductase n=1 Tax=Beijerinckia sp. L45 TaxID=1641855 RepID=UPI00131EAC5A|nr:flavin-dependent oxidoreductase [Beijerinckia sp. L45]